MKAVTRNRVIALVSTVVPMTMLILALSAPQSGASGGACCQEVDQGLASPRRMAGTEGKIEMKLRPHTFPLIHDMMTTAVSIAGRL
jgi:hypothetical protein